MGNSQGAEAATCTESEEQYAVRGAKERLNTFAEALKDIEKADQKRLNVFTAVGMNTQEVKHSKFLAWLFDPQKPHGLGNDFLRRFWEKLFFYRHALADEGVPQNREILQKAGICGITELSNFIGDPKLKVFTEKTILEGDRRMDICIESRATKTVLVIENKVFTSTHDEQLQAYEDKLQNLGAGWRKILVYLTPKGDIPTDDGVYNPRWCIFDYNVILQIMREMLEAHKLMLRKFKYMRVKFLMEDYIDMVNFEILDNNPEIYSMCKKIRKEHADALEILMRYSDNLSEVYASCADWVRQTFTDRLEIIQTSERQCDFITKPIADFFRRKGCNIVVENGGYAFHCGISSKDGPVVMLAGLETDNGIWSEAQMQVGHAVHPNREIKDRRFHRLFTVQLLKEEDRQKKWEEVSETLKDHLREFQNKLEELEATLINLP